ncbi:hypothetical protein KCU93_g139, partial [Aureobasidium melanogenum]
MDDWSRGVVNGDAVVIAEAYQTETDGKHRSMACQSDGVEGSVDVGSAFFRQRGSHDAGQHLQMVGSCCSGEIAKGDELDVLSMDIPEWLRSVGRKVPSSRPETALSRNGGTRRLGSVGTC